MMTGLLDEDNIPQCKVCLCNCHCMSLCQCQFDGCDCPNGEEDA